jgi:general secretion pathway protein F
MMLSSKLPIKEIIEILLNSNPKGFKKDILLVIDKSLQDGKPIYKSLEVFQKELGYLPILFFKLGEENSNLETALRSLYEILEENQRIEEKIKNALRYPLILLGSFAMSLGFIFYFVLPQFEFIFEEFGSNLPMSTTILLFIKDLLFEHFSLIIGIGLFCSVVFYALCRKYKYIIDKIKYHSIPYFSSLERYLLLYKFFLSVSLIVKSKHKFQDAIYYGKEINRNDYFNDKISQIIDELNDGSSIVETFLRSLLFDELTIRMITVGENSNNLEVVLEDLKNINKKQLDKNLETFIAFLNPFLIFIISSIILWLVLAIMTPVWEMGNFIK